MKPSSSDFIASMLARSATGWTAHGVTFPPEDVRATRMPAKRKVQPAPRGPAPPSLARPSTPRPAKPRKTRVNRKPTRLQLVQAARREVVRAAFARWVAEGREFRAWELAESLGMVTKTVQADLRELGLKSPAWRDGKRQRAVVA
jgi:hypothetical protein